MAETITGSVSFSVAPASGGIQVANAYTLRSETHTKHMDHVAVIPAGLTDYAIPLADFSTVALILLKSTDNPFSYRIGVGVASGYQLRTCRKFAVETPNNDAVPTVYVTTNGTKAAANITISGVAHTGDVVTAIINGTTVTYTVIGGDTLVSIAVGLAAAINANGTLNTLVSASAALGMVTVIALASGTVANGYGFVASVGGVGATVIATASSPTMVGGASPAPVSLNLFVVGD